MSEIKIPIPARLKNVAKGGHVAGAADIIDDALNKKQSVINEETLNSLEGLDGRIDTVQQKVDDIGDSIQFDEDGDLVTEDGGDFSDDTARGKIPTIGAIKDGADDEPTAESHNLVKSGGVANMYGSYEENDEFIIAVIDKDRRLLYGVKYNGDFYFAKGVPEQVQSYILDAISFASAEIKKQIKEQLDDSIPFQYLSEMETMDFIEVHIDDNKKILYGVEPNGNFYFGGGVPRQIKEYIQTKLDERSDYSETEKLVDTISDKRLIVPDYYFTDDYLPNKVKRINQICRNADTDTFIFTTDEHWDRSSKKSPSIINYLDKYTRFSKMISTGDHVQVINEYGQAEISESCFDYMYMLDQCTKKPKYSAVGNHEVLTGEYDANTFDGINLRDWYHYIYYTNLNEAVVGDIPRMYFYKDDTAKKMRYIYLSAFDVDGEEAVGGNKYRIKAKLDWDNEQLDWLINTALNVDSGYGIIVIVHMLVTVTADNQHSDSGLNITINPGAKSFANALLNYNGNGKVLAVLEGHHHRDGITMIDDTFLANTGDDITNNALFSIGTTCDANNFSGLPAEALVYRDSGTSNEIAFDFCSVDRSKSIITLVRLGAPANNDYLYQGNSFLEERSVCYEIINIDIGEDYTILNDLASNVIWTSSRTNIATVSNGTVHGIASGFTRISAVDSNNRSILYIVKVN